MTNPTPSAEEQLKDRVETIKILFKNDWQATDCDFDTCLRWLGDNVKLQIRQAEQAARADEREKCNAISKELVGLGRADERRKTLEEAANLCASSGWHGGLLSDKLRALTNESGEPGEAA